MRDFKELDVVQVVSLRHPPTERSVLSSYDPPKLPAVGDMGAIVCVLGDRFSVECVEPTGYTAWLADFDRDELSLIASPERR